ncbi:MAG TPA: 4-hydroxy-tetrahydrodipicolinate reductase [Candidatus Hydrogenedentes bacterium]|nr:4-hydroxy-tetrahydrodipicolinate reductase [Candidatus Hydrogenedentota bacterium]
MKICVAGACGRMGRRILEMAVADGIEVGAALDLPENAGMELVYGLESGRSCSVTVCASPHDAMKMADVLIDFTQPEGCARNVETALELGRPAVVGTTGLDETGRAVLRRAAERVAVVHAPNMSVGVNLLFKLVREVAAILGESYNVEIVEAHHNRKKDSPSGTALKLAERAAEGLGWNLDEVLRHGREGLVGARPSREIGMHAVRAGDIVGEHTVMFVGPGERIELTHKAHNRDNFARGALLAAKFAVTARPGLYDMQDVLGLR